jgi:hypothetical protein
MRVVGLKRGCPRGLERALQGDRSSLKKFARFFLVR